MLQRSKLEEPNYWHMWRHLHQLCSLQRAVGEGEDGREKGLWQDAQAEIPIPLKNAFFQKKKENQNIQDHLHERGHSGELDKAANAVCRMFWR